MKCLFVIAVALLSQLSYAGAEERPGRKLVKDSTSSCEISVPDNWGQAVLLVKSGGKVRTFSDQTQKQVADRMLSNTPELVFYVMKSNSSSGAQPLVTYQASVPGNGYHCTAQINVKPSFPEADVQKIVATFKASRQ